MMRRMKYKITLLTLVMLALGIIFSSCSIMEDNKPPTAPLLTVTDVQSSYVTLAWSESYDNIGVAEYKLYRDGELLDTTEDTEYKDKDVKDGSVYEYYVVAYDEAGNRSSKSVKQNVTVGGDVKTASNDVETPNSTEAPKSTETPASTEPSVSTGTPDTPKDSGSKQDLNKLAKSTVRVYMLDDNLNIIGFGSGTIMNEQGYILTNYHVVGTENGLNNSDGYVAIALTNDVRVNTQPEYFAIFRGGDQPLDLAVVQITEDINGKFVNPEDLKLSPAKIGDSDKVQMGDAIDILGYPGVGNDTITFTSGTISGFTDDNYDNTVDWIKTDAMVNHGNSGGTALNDQGELIGVPSAKLTGEDYDVMFLIRPINQAIPILEAAISQGDNAELPPTTNPDNVNPGTDNPDTNASSIEITGRIVDAYTSEPLMGAVFVVLQPGVTCDEFSNDPQDSMILAYAETDQDGLFDCTGIPAGSTYSVIVGIEGYISILEDDALEIPADYYGVLDLGDVTLEPGQ